MSNEMRRNVGMRFIVKLTDGTKQDINIDESDTYDTFAQKVVELGNFDSVRSVRFICKGKIVNAQNFKEFGPGSLMLCLRSSGSNTEPRSNIQTNNFSHQSVNAQSANAQSDEPTYTYKNIKATLVVFLNLIRTNPQLRELYDHDYNQLVTEILKNNDLDTMLRNILSQSGQIMRAMESGENISVNVNGNTGPGQPGDMEQIDLSIQDQETIEEITAMGFDRTEVVVAYIKSGKNKEDTINSLLNA